MKNGPISLVSRFGIPMSAERVNFVRRCLAKFGCLIITTNSKDKYSRLGDPVDHVWGFDPPWPFFVVGFGEESDWLAQKDLAEECGTKPLRGVNDHVPRGVRVVKIATD